MRPCDLDRFPARVLHLPPRHVARPRRGRGLRHVHRRSAHALRAVAAPLPGHARLLRQRHPRRARPRARVLPDGGRARRGGDVRPRDVLLQHRHAEIQRPAGIRQRRPRIDVAPRGQGEVRPLLHGQGGHQRGRARRRHLQAPRPPHERAALRLRPAEGRGLRAGRQLADDSQRPPRHGRVRIGLPGCLRRNPDGPVRRAAGAQAGAHVQRRRRLHHAPRGIQIGQRGRHPQRRVPDLRDGGGEPLGRVPEHRPKLPRVHPVQGLRGPARRPGDGAHGRYQGGAPRCPQGQGQDEARGQLLVHRVRRVGPPVGAPAAQRRGRHRLSHRRAKLARCDNGAGDRGRRPLRGDGKARRFIRSGFVTETEGGSW